MGIGGEFNKIASRNVLCEISNALTSLHSDLLYLELNDSNSTFDEYAETLKKTVVCYIDNQKTVFKKLREELSPSYEAVCNRMEKPEKKVVELEKQAREQPDIDRIVE